MSWNHYTTGWDVFDKQVETLKKLYNARFPGAEDEDDLDKALDWQEYTTPCKVKTLYYPSDLDGEPRNLRLVRFVEPDTGVRWTLEEWLAVDDRDCDGTSRVTTTLYQEGQRPVLETQTLAPA
jgi:hypothetical protein